MSVLLIAEHNNKELRPFTLNAVTAASQIDQDVHAVIIGHNSEEAVKALSALPKLKKLLVLKHLIMKILQQKILLQLL